MPPAADSSRQLPSSTPPPGYLPYRNRQNQKNRQVLVPSPSASFSLSSLFPGTQSIRNGGLRVSPPTSSVPHTRRRHGIPHPRIPRCLFSTRSQPGEKFFRFDARTSFNSILYATFLRLDFQHASAASQLVYAPYGSQPYLTVAGQLLCSAEGTKKGDPLVRLLLCLVIHQIVKRINDACSLDMNAWYAD